MGSFEQDIADGSDLSYVALNFIGEELGGLFRRGGSKAVEEFIHWSNKLKDIGNREIYELYLWKFYVYLPQEDRPKIVQLFKRADATWELEQIGLAERLRKEPSDIELHRPEPSRQRWASSRYDHSPQDSSSRSSRLWPHPLLLATTILSIILSVTGMASIVDGFIVWIDFFHHLIDLYRANIREPLQLGLKAIYPSNWPLPPLVLYDAVIVLSALYAGLCLLVRFGSEELATLFRIFIPSAQNDPISKKKKDSFVISILRHIGQWLFGPLLLISIGVAFFRVRAGYREAIDQFHINKFKLWIIAHGASLVGFDPIIEQSQLLERYRRRSQHDQLMLLRAFVLYIITFLLFSIILFINFQIQRKK